ncbi:DnaJ-domain-containing protein [Hymenopellis radicata]|nr:DnaJ-domain-containing protein [Hymenopellis radicata]
MATNLYQVLNIPSTATTDEVKRAYRKLALQTHPDRLSPTATPEQKTRSAEQFRLINNAYEVLIDPEKRRIFDLHGVYPAPVTVEEPSRGTPYAGGGAHHRSHPRYRSTPDLVSTTLMIPSLRFLDSPSRIFQLFDDFFRDFERDPFFTTTPFPSPIRSNLHSRSLFADPFNLFPAPHDAFSDPFWSSRSLLDHPTASSGYRRTANFDGRNGQWQSESTFSVSTNKGTQTVHKRIDANGNEHVTKTYPDGRQSYKINGVKQAPPSGGHISNGNVNTPAQQYLPPPAPTATQPPAPTPSATPWGSDVANAGSSSSSYRHRQGKHHRY